MKGVWSPAQAEKAAPPLMNMEDWQSQQRAQRNKERQSKTQSTQNLHNYRGTLKEDDLKMQALRDEERKKKKETEQYLNLLGKGGDISALEKGAVKSPRTDGLEIAKGTIKSATDAFQQQLSQQNSPRKVPGAPTVYTREEGEQASNVAAKKEATAATGEDKPLQGHPTIVRLDVTFTFGLITLKDSPDVDAYMLAIQEVVSGTLHDHTDVAEHVSYQPTFPPFVRSVTKDDSFKDNSGSTSSRFLVKACVPVFLANGISIHSARDGIISAIRASVENGTFYEIASRGE